MNWEDMTTKNDGTYAEVWCLEFNRDYTEWLSVGLRHDGVYETWNYKCSGDTLLPATNMDEAKALALVLFKMR